jgi:hypothetical protein
MVKRRFRVGDLIGVLLQKKEPECLHLTRKGLKAVEEALRKGQWEIVESTG